MVPKLGFLGAKNSNLNFWRENEESNSLVCLGHFRVFGVFWMPKPPQKVKKNWNRVPRRGDLKIWHKLYHLCQEGQIANFPAKISKNLNFLPRFCLKIIFWVPKYICISKKLDFSFSRQKFKFSFSHPNRPIYGKKLLSLLSTNVLTTQVAQRKKLY